MSTLNTPIANRVIKKKLLSKSRRETQLHQCSRGDDVCNSDDCVLHEQSPAQSHWELFPFVNKAYGDKPRDYDFLV